MRSVQLFTQVLIVLVFLSIGAVAPRPICGDNSKNRAPEQCDGTDLGGATCQSVNSNFVGGTLGCTSGCLYNTANCIANVCGDNIVKGSEQCDGTNLNGQTCNTLGYNGGTLSCTNCAYNTAGCNQEVFPDIDCITGMVDLLEVQACYENHFQCNDCMAGTATSNLNFPDATQTSAIQSLMNTMLTNDGNCNTISVPAAIFNMIMVKTFTDQTNGVQYCIALDHRDDDADGRFDYAWFLFITPNFRKDVSRLAHFQGVHSGYDINTMNQNIRVARAIGARSVIVTGAHRYAVAPSGSTCQSTDGPTDPAHDDKTGMHKAWLQIYATSVTQGWNPWHFQLHGMGTDTCGVDIFISYGATTTSLYTAPNNVAKGLYDYVRNTTSFSAGMPNNDDCSFTATTNLQGRIVNKVAASPSNWVCTHAANNADVTSKFVHIEQKSAPRDTTNNFWYNIFKNVIPTSCSGGRHVDPVSKLCVD
jgi:hypothetical protein